MKQIRWIVLALACTAGGPAWSAAAPQARGLATAVVGQVAAQLQERYPFPDLSAAYARQLRRQLQAGRYDGLDAQALAKAVSADLQSVHKDVHLRVMRNHDLFVQASDEAARQDTPEDQARRQAQQRKANHGFTAVEIDAGSATAYVKSGGPWWPSDDTFAVAAGAMRLAADARNVILDIRGNPGGGGEVGRFLASYFFEPGEEQYYLYGFEKDRSHDQQEWTYAYVPGPRLARAKLYILVDAHTASAAEGFAYAMQKLGRATVVGEKTAGAGIAGSFVPLREDIVMFLPVKMIVAPHTQAGWEGVGVIPDVPAGGKDARQLAMDLIRGNGPAPGSTAAAP